MAQTYVVGQVNSQIELKTSAKSNPYVRFELVESIGGKTNSRTQFFHVCAFADNALSIVEAGVRQGSIIKVYGMLEMETYGKQDESVDKRMKIMLTAWGLYPIGASKEKGSLDKALPKRVEPMKVITIDGEKEPLPN